MSLVRKLYLKGSFSTSLYNLCGKAVGYLIPFFIGIWFGVAEEMDIFFYVYGVIFFLTMIFSNALENIVVPIVADYRNNHGSDKLAVFLGRLSILIFLALGVAVTAVHLFGERVFGLVTTFSPEQIDRLLGYFRAFIPFAFLLTFASLFNGVLNSYKIFWLPAISPALRSVVCILAIFALKDQFEIHAIIIGYTLGELVRLSCLIFYCATTKIFALRIDLNFDRDVAGIFSKTVFLMLGTLIVGMNPIVDNTIASWLPAGSIALIEYTNKLAAIPFNLLTFGLLTVLLSHLSEIFHKEGAPTFRAMVFRQAKFLLVVSFATSAVMILFSPQAVHLCYGQGKITPESLTVISQLFVISMAGFVPYMVTQVFVRGFLVLKATKVLLYIAVWKFSLNVILDLIGVTLWGIYGIVVASSVLNYVLTGIAIWYFSNLMNNAAGKGGDTPVKTELALSPGS